MRPRSPGKRILDILDHRNVEKDKTIPAALFTTAAPLEVMNKCNTARPEADHDPEKMAALAIAVHRLSGFESISYPFDGTLIAEAFGCRIKWGKEDIPPAVLEGLDVPFEDIDIPSDLLENGRIPALFEATRIIRKEIKDEAAIVCGLSGPVDLVSELIGMKSFLVLLLKEPGVAERLLNVATEACILVANKCLEEGADVVKFGDAVTSPDIVPPAMFISTIKPVYTKLVDSVKGKCVIHVCGKTDPIIGELAECGFCGVSIEEDVEDLRGAVENVHEHSSVLIGNVSTSKTIYNGTPEEVRKEAMMAMEAGIDILAPGCGIAPQSPLVNLRAIVEARDEYSTGTLYL